MLVISNDLNLKCGLNIVFFFKFVDFDIFIKSFVFFFPFSGFVVLTTLDHIAEQATQKTSSLQLSAVALLYQLAGLQCLSRF